MSIVDFLMKLIRRLVDDANLDWRDREILARQLYQFHCELDPCDTDPDWDR